MDLTWCIVIILIVIALGVWALEKPFHLPAISLMILQQVGLIIFYDLYQCQHYVPAVIFVLLLAINSIYMWHYTFKENLTFLFIANMIAAYLTGFIYEI